MRAKTRSAIILAGGDSKRFGSFKALFMIRNKPMISYVIDACLAIPFEDILVVTSSSDKEKMIQEVVPRGVHVVRDDIERYPVTGPLCGIATGLEQVKTDFTFITACDIPLLRPRLVGYLLRRITVDVEAIIPRWPNGFIEPLLAVYQTVRTLNSVRIAIREGNRNLRSFITPLKKVDYVSVDELRSVDRELISLLNVNTPNDLTGLSRRMRTM
ncbi:MAG: molybdenum cofactor guanylyltransferase [Candidatus Bathyarchaeia archaeon]